MAGRSNLLYLNVVSRIHKFEILWQVSSIASIVFSVSTVASTWAEKIQQPFSSPLQECCSSLTLAASRTWSEMVSNFLFDWSFSIQIAAGIFVFPIETRSQSRRAGKSFRSVNMELYLLCRTSPFTISVYVHEPLNSFKLSRTFCACCCVIFMNIHLDVFRG